VTSPQLPTTHAIILAAGSGSRLGGDGTSLPKPLQPVGGRALVDRVIDTFLAVGVRQFTVVTGFAKEEITSHLRTQRWPEADLAFVENPDWQKKNGLSVLAARDTVAGPFFLSMADHVFAPALVATLAAAVRSPEWLYLAVDRKLSSIFDMDDATKVQTKGDEIIQIGKELPTFDAVDTGVFICPPALFAHLESVKVDGDCSLSDGVRSMAVAGRARAVDVGDALWQDVDTPEMLAQAEAQLAAQRREFSGR